MAPIWSLYVDESGRFDGSEHSVVVGVLIEASAGALAQTRLRQELATIWGPGPWPPHATDLNLPGSLVLHAVYGGAAAWMPEGRDFVPARAAVAQLRQELRRHFSHRLNEIEAGAYPTRSDLEVATRLLEHHPAMPAVRAVRQVQFDRMQELTSSVLSKRRSAVLVVLADRDPPGPEPGPVQVRPDSYTRALDCLLDRAGRLAQDARVECRILSRDVEVGGLGKQPYQGGLLRPVLERVGTATGATLKGAPFVQRYREGGAQGQDFHPMLVLADFLANRIRGDLIACRRDLAELISDLADGRGIPRDALEFRAPAGALLDPLPTLQCAGAFEVAVQAAFRRAPVPPLPGAPLWADQSARRWIAAAGRWS